MADLLLPPRSVPALHANPLKSQSKSNTKIVSRPSPTTGVVGTLHRAIKEANDAWLSWKDGLTEHERQQTILLEERRQILGQRMQDVILALNQTSPSFILWSMLTVTGGIPCAVAQGSTRTRCPRGERGMEERCRGGRLQPPIDRRPTQRT